LDLVVLKVYRVLLAPQENLVEVVEVLVSVASPQTTLMREIFGLTILRVVCLFI